MALTMREDAWATWKPKTLESKKSVSPNKLTMPPVAIECVRNIRQEALASFWEACHVAKQNVIKPDHIWFWGFIEDLVRAFDSAMETDKNRYGGTYSTDPIAPGVPPCSPCQSRRRASRALEVLNYLTEDDLPSERPGGHWS